MKLNRTLIAMSAVLVSTVSFAQYGAVQYGTQYEEPEVVFDIRKTVAQNPYQIAFVPFANDRTVSSVVVNDLQHTELKTTSQNLPSNNAHSSAQINPNLSAWQASGFNYVVVGQVSPSAGGKVAIVFEVIEIATGRVMMGTQTQLADNNASALRHASHVVSDKIYEIITGEKGDFSGKIAYVEETGTGRNKISTLKVMDADGQNVRTLFSEQGSIFSPAWSPDGTRLAYAVQKPNGFPVIHVQSATGGGSQVVTPYKGNNLGPSFSPDGLSLLFSGSHENNDPAIYQLNLGSRQLRKLTNMVGAENSPSHTADGRSFVFSADNGSRTPKLYRYDLYTGQISPIGRGQAASPRISPDGNKIAYVSGRSLIVANTTGGGSTTIGATGIDESASFSPNSNRIIYSSYQGGRGQMTIRSLKTGQSFSIATQGTVREPTWSRGNN